MMTVGRMGDGRRRADRPQTNRAHEPSDEGERVTLSWIGAAPLAPAALSVTLRGGSDDSSRDDPSDLLARCPEFQQRPNE